MEISAENDFLKIRSETHKSLNIIAPTLEHLFKLSDLKNIYEQIGPVKNENEFISRIFSLLKLNISFSEKQLESIPRDIPLIVIANHPFGGIEGLIMFNVISKVRPDFKIMANYLLKRIPELQDIFIAVDPFGNNGSKVNNIKPLKDAISWIRSGKVLGIFPAGQVSSFQINKKEITDPKWNPNIAHLIRKTSAAVLPIYFDGSNSLLFNMLGLVNPWIRTAMLPREFLNKKNKDIRLQIGKVVQSEQLKVFTDDQLLIKYLRMQTYLLANRFFQSKENSIKKEQTKKITKAIYKAAKINNEIKKLPNTSFLFSQDVFNVYIAKASQIPCLLNEIGRLREITFRAAGEGSGKECDLDKYDNHYLHLFIWHNDENKVIGSYRLGLSDRILDEFGKKGLYTHSLFKLRNKLFKKMNPAIELGRSFVIEEYQRSFAPLMLLWKGIGQFLVRNPQYRFLFGPVSISSTFSPVSRQMIVDYFKEKELMKKWAKWVKGRYVPDETAVKGFSMKKDADLVVKISDLNKLISVVENKPAEVPILLKQYLKLNAKMLGFNPDPDFSNVLDILVVVDLLKTPHNVLQKYFGKEGLQSYLRYHENLPKRKLKETKSM